MINDQPQLECSGKSDYEQKISHFGSNTESTPASLGVVGHVSIQAAERISEEGHDPAVPETPLCAGGVPRHRGVEDGGQVYDLCQRGGGEDLGEEVAAELLQQLVHAAEGEQQGLGGGGRGAQQPARLPPVQPHQQQVRPHTRHTPAQQIDIKSLEE